MYKRSPSNLLDITDPYTAYCLDEACAYIIKKLEAGEEPTFRKEFKSFADMYRHYD